MKHENETHMLIFSFWPCLPRPPLGKDIVFRFVIEYHSLRDFGFFLKIIVLHGEIFEFS